MVREPDPDPIRNGGADVTAAMNIVSEKTVICMPDPQDGTRWAELMTINGISLHVDVPGGLASTSTELLIDGASYLPMQSSIEITTVEGGVSLVTTVAVGANRHRTA